MASTHVYLPNTCLLTDYYQLTMAYALFKKGRAHHTCVFQYFFRDLPFNANFAIAAGFAEATDLISSFNFDEDSLKYLSSLPHFDNDFIHYLRNLKPLVNLYTVNDGEAVFPHEPLLVIEGPLALCQLLETILLNCLNFHTLIATKAARLRIAAQGKHLSDFGLRRAQGIDGAITASKAAFIGGIDATSNVWAAHRFGIPLSGTQAHSFIMSYEKQADAFRDFSEIFSDSCTLLVDTYGTNQGLRDAIKMWQKNTPKTLAVRLDSGDLEVLSQKARSMLDEAGFKQARIIVSGDLDEFKIAELINANAPIDAFGVGTRLASGYPDLAINGVYKLQAIKEGDKWRDTYKISDQPYKQTWPGQQRVKRIFKHNKAAFDLVYEPLGHTDIGGLLHLRIKEGNLVGKTPTLWEKRAYCQKSLAELPDEIKTIKKSSNPDEIRFTPELANKRMRYEGSFAD